jgi:LemA protein
MKKKAGMLAGVLITLGVILLIVLMVGGWIAGTYNELVVRDTTTEKGWGYVQSAYQRRADLIPNLVDIVKGARDFEKSTLIEVTKLRSQTGSIKQQISDAKTTDELQTAGNDMNGVLSRLLVIVEAYPDLKTNQNFLALQDELAGTENRINFERNNYNTEVMNYKTAVRSFPANIIAGMFGFSVDKWKTFEAEKTSQEAPKIDFTQ